MLSAPLMSPSSEAEASLLTSCVVQHATLSLVQGLGEPLTMVVMVPAMGQNEGCVGLRVVCVSWAGWLLLPLSSLTPQSSVLAPQPVPDSSALSSALSR